MAAARSLCDLLDIIEALKERGTGFRSLAEDIDTAKPAGEQILHAFASIAHFEHRVTQRLSTPVVITDHKSLS